MTSTMNSNAISALVNNSSNCPSVAHSPNSTSTSSSPSSCLINQSSDKSDGPVKPVSSVAEESKTELKEHGPTPPPSGISSKSIPKKKTVPIEKMFETFHQSPNGDFKPTFYNPFEVKHRRRTSRSQFKILEKAFMDNCKPSSAVRKALAQELNMSTRSIQVWFQNRRAKLKTMMKNGKLTESQMMEYLSNQQRQDDDNCEDEHDQTSPSSFEDSEGSENEQSSNKSFLNVDRRSFPNSQPATVPVNVSVASNSMKLGNSYPNQSRSRSYSLPEIQRSPKLPFKQLQEALFGNSQQQQHINNGNSVNNFYHPQQQQQQQHHQHQEYYNNSLNAFQHYFRASNAAMNHVNNNQGQIPAYYSNNPQISVSNLNYTPLSQVQAAANHNFEYQRPRSSSFAVGQRSSNYAMNNGNYEMLSVIKEDSPISEYMNIPNAFESQYFDESTGMNNHPINQLDLDYFMSSNPVYDQGHQSYLSSFEGSSTVASLPVSVPQSPETRLLSESGNNRTAGNYIHDLAFLPQPTNEILLTTLIEDDQYLH